MSPGYINGKDSLYSIKSSFEEQGRQWTVWCYSQVFTCKVEWVMWRHHCVLWSHYFWQHPYVWARMSAAQLWTKRINIHSVTSQIVRHSVFEYYCNRCNRNILCTALCMLQCWNLKWETFWLENYNSLYFSSLSSVKNVYFHKPSFSPSSQTTSCIVFEVSFIHNTGLLWRFITRKIQYNFDVKLNKDQRLQETHSLLQINIFWLIWFQCHLKSLYQ